jgi:hypothetical protein
MRFVPKISTKISTTITSFKRLTPPRPMPALHHNGRLLEPLMIRHSPPA